MSDEYINDSTDKAAKKACEFPLNRTYITTITSKNPSFLCPFNWVSSRSPNKCIGLRECKVIPYAVSFNANFEYKWTEDEKEETGAITFTITATPEHSMAQIIKVIDDEINAGIERNGHGDVLVFDAKYNNNTVSFRIVHSGGFDVSFRFRIGYKGLGKLFGMNDADARAILHEFAEAIININNVWDRVNLFIHSTISEDNNQILCERDYKYSPKKYLFPCNQPGFTLWFSSDGTTPINISNSQVILKVAFIYNFKTAAI